MPIGSVFALFLNVRFRLERIGFWPRSGPIASSDLIRFSPRLRILLGFCLLGGAVPSICAVGQTTPQHAGSEVSINPRSIRLPIVDATDNRFVRLSTAQGVSQIKVDQIVQDDEGFMWFGTRYGLYRYDGYSFKVFVRDPGNPNSLDGVVVNALFKDHDGSDATNPSTSLTGPRRLLRVIRFQSPITLPKTLAGCSR